MADLNGRTLGAYRVLEQLGVGGMATVYKAYHAAEDFQEALRQAIEAKDDSRRAQVEAELAKIK